MASARYVNTRDNKIVSRRWNLICLPSRRGLKPKKTHLGRLKDGERRDGGNCWPRKNLLGYAKVFLHSLQARAEMSLAGSLDHVPPHRVWAYLYGDGEFRVQEHDHILECKPCLRLFILCLNSESFGAVLRASAEAESA